MTDTTFNVSPEVTRKRDREIVDYVGALRTALRRPIEQHWLPRNPVVACDDDHTLLTALCYSFYDHVPLRLTPDAIWITLARGFALHVNKNAEELRHKFVCHSGKEKTHGNSNGFLSRKRESMAGGICTQNLPQVEWKFLQSWEEFTNDCSRHGVIYWVFDDL